MAKTVTISDECFDRIKEQIEEAYKPSGKAYIVFSATRDIFFGFCEEGPSSRMVLKDARRVFSYPKHPNCGGPDALAVYGAYTGVKAGPKVPELTVENVANSARCTEQGEKSWAKKPEQW